MMHLLKVNQEWEKPKFTQPIIKGKRALYTAKNWVSEFDSNRILNKGTDFQPTIRYYKEESYYILYVIINSKI